MTKPRIVFAGTPDFAAHCLEQLLNDAYQVVAVYTQPDRRAGRGKKLQPSPVKQLAVQHNIPVEQPINFKDESHLKQLASYDADLMIVVAYGILLPQSVLDTPRLGCINVHASLLPRWRGAAPIQRAIEAGDDKTGVAIMQMDAGLDTGPVWQSAELALTGEETGASLHDELAKIGAQTLSNCLPTILQGSSQPTAQSQQGVTYAHKLSKQQAAIDWQDPADVIARKVRAFNAWPVAFFKVGDDPVKVWQAIASDEQHDQQPGTVLGADKSGIEIACGNGRLTLLELQPAGKKRMKAGDLLNSRAQWFVPNQMVGE